jgi:predicted dehydrogenase
VARKKTDVEISIFKSSQEPSSFKIQNQKALMQNQSDNATSAVSRRQFIKTSSLVAASAAAVSFPSVLLAQNKQPIRAVIIGVGGRGGGAGRDFTEAVKNLGVDGKIVAVADLFPEAARRGTENFGVPANKCFSGFDAYQKALEEPGVNYAILATPPGFRASHFKACIAAGKNVFMEKPVAVDGAGIRIVYEAADEATKKNLKVAAGTQRRHRPSYIETVKRLQDGAIGDMTALRVYWVNGGPIWHRGDQGSTDLERQIRNWYHYIWLCGDHICEQHVHNIDIANWIMKGHPVKCWGMGARQQLEGKSGEIWDNFAIEYQYANGVRCHAYCGQVKRSWSSVSEAVAGSTGVAELHDGRNFIKPKDGKMWRPGEIKEDNGYVNEHRDLIQAILNDTPLNEGRQVADSTLTAIMGREAAYSGSEVEWETALNSNFTYGPDLLYKDCAKLAFSPFRTLQPPNPGSHDIFKNPPAVPIAKA